MKLLFVIGFILVVSSYLGIRTEVFPPTPGQRIIGEPSKGELVLAVSLLIGLVCWIVGLIWWAIA